ncbi:MAG: hypothetical protein N2645_06880 [Clostridia bacterium]|nr:hypothetical protein [Clostridia bacterium]
MESVWESVYCPQQLEYLKNITYETSRISKYFQVFLYSMYLAVGMIIGFLFARYLVRIIKRAFKFKVQF